jgi:hypothetical protein
VISGSPLFGREESSPLAQSRRAYASCQASGKPISICCHAIPLLIPDQQQNRIHREGICRDETSFEIQRVKRAPIGANEALGELEAPTFLIPNKATPQRCHRRRSLRPRRANWVGFANPPPFASRPIALGIALIAADTGRGGPELSVGDGSPTTARGR